MSVIRCCGQMKHKAEIRDRCVLKDRALRQSIDTVRHDEKDLLLHKLSLDIAADSSPGKLRVIWVWKEIDYNFITVSALAAP